MGIERYSENSPNEIPFIPDLSLPEIRDIEETRRTSDLPLGEEILAFTEDCIIGEVEITDKKYNVKAIHSYDGNMYLGEHPNSTIQDSIVEDLPKFAAMLQGAADKLDSLPDVNDAHQELIDQAYEITGLQDRKIKMLDEKTYNQTISEFGQRPGTGGQFLHDHILIKANGANELKKLVHELNHSGGEASQDIPVYTFQNPETEKIDRHISDRQAGLSAWAIDHRGKLIMTNRFFEESYTELKTLKQLVASGELNPSNEEQLNYAIEYEEGRSTMILPESARYVDPLHGLSLLEKLSPGLIEDLDHAHGNRPQFQVVIDRLDQIHPDLYKHLRELRSDNLNNLVDIVSPIYFLGMIDRDSLDIRDIQNSIYDLGVTPD